MILRIMGAVFVLVGMTYAGVLAIYRMQVRLACLQAFETSFVFMQQELQFAQIRMAQVCIHIAEAIQNQIVREFYKEFAAQLQSKEKQKFSQLWIWKIRECQKQAYLTAADITILSEVGAIPFCLDGAAQAKMIGQVDEHLKRHTEALRIQIEQKRKLYQYGGAIAGVFIVILLL